MTTTTASPRGLDLTALDAYLRHHGVPREGALAAEFISGGRSNLTYLVRDDRSRWVLRRPPTHGTTPSAHDVTREYRVAAGLQATPVPVPAPVAVCADSSVLDAPFAMFEFVDGRVIRTRDELDSLGGVAAITATVNALVDVLASLHGVDVAQAGLSGLGKPAGYLERQVTRWASQWSHVRLPDDPREADVARLTAALHANLPPSQRITIVHGDYRIDNTILDHHDPTRIRAVLDWELSTLGDPLSDVALMCVYRDPAMDLVIGQSAAWTSPLLPDADDLAHRYSLVADQPLQYWTFHMALGYFKLAVIAAGIAYRQRSSDQPDPCDRAADAVGPLIASGLHAI